MENKEGCRAAKLFIFNKLLAKPDCRSRSVLNMTLISTGNEGLGNGFLDHVCDGSVN